MISMKFASFLSFFASLWRHFYGFYGFLNLYFFPKFHFIFENSSGMKGLTDDSNELATTIAGYIAKKLINAQVALFVNLV